MPLCALVPSLVRDESLPERREGFDELWLPLLQIYTVAACDDVSYVLFMFGMTYRDNVLVCNHFF